MITEEQLLQHIYTYKHTQHNSTSKETLRWKFFDAFGLFVDLEQIDDDGYIHIGDFRFDENYEPEWNMDLLCPYCHQCFSVCYWASNISDLSRSLEQNKHQCLNDTTVTLQRDKEHKWTIKNT